MRLLPVIILTALLGASAVQSGETQTENWKRCTSDDPEKSLRACSALIQSGDETGFRLAKAFYDRGLAYAHEGNCDLAVKDYDQSLRLNPTFAYAFYSRGAAHASKSDYDHAFQDYNHALQLNPSLTFALYWPARVFVPRRMREFTSQLGPLNLS